MKKRSALTLIMALGVMAMFGSTGFDPPVQKTQSYDLFYSASSETADLNAAAIASFETILQGIEVDQTIQETASAERAAWYEGIEALTSRAIDNYQPTYIARTDHSKNLQAKNPIASRRWHMDQNRMQHRSC